MTIEPSINDIVDAIHLKLWDDPDYHRYFNSVYDEDSEEGSIMADNLCAARMVREYAIQKQTIAEDGKVIELGRIGSARLATIMHSLNVVLRRYGMDRKSRRDAIADEGDNDHV